MIIEMLMLFFLWFEWIKEERRVYIEESGYGGQEQRKGVWKGRRKEFLKRGGENYI